MKTTDESSVSVNKPPAVLIDFDDTAAQQNVAELLLTRFGDPTWQDVRQRFRAGEFTLNEYQEITFRNIQADRSAMQGYVKQHANLRPHIRELWDYCQAHSIPMAIVSQGLDFYIEALLEEAGLLQMPVYAVDTQFGAQGITYGYRHIRPGQERQGNSKGLVVDRYRQDGHYVFYVGDGISDFEAASRVDLLFAHRTLAEKCTSEKIPFRPFTGFQDLLLALQEYHRDGHQPEGGQPQFGTASNIPGGGEGDSK